MHKFCPLSFFSFYVNKNQAQAGGAHVCVEEECAWWDEHCNQCQVKTALELVGVIAEAPRVRSTRKTEKAVAGVSDMFSRLRNKSKRKLPTAGDKEAAKPTETKPAVTQAATPVVAKPPETPVVKPVEAPEVKPAAPVIPVSEKPAEVKIVPEKPAETNAAVTAAPAIPAEEAPVTPVAPVALATPAAPVTSTPKEMITEPQPIPETTESKPVEEPKPADQFDDLLNLPETPVSELPIVSLLRASYYSSINVKCTLVL